MPGLEGISFHYYCTTTTKEIQHQIQPGIVSDISFLTNPTIKQGPC